MGVFTVKKQGTKIVERINWFFLKKFERSEIRSSNLKTRLSIPKYFEN